MAGPMTNDIVPVLNTKNLQHGQSNGDASVGPLKLKKEKHEQNEKRDSHCFMNKISNQSFKIGDQQEEIPSRTENLIPKSTVID